MNISLNFNPPIKHKNKITPNLARHINKNSISRVSTDLAVTVVEIIMTTLPPVPAYSHIIAGKPDYSHYTSAFCCETSHAMWRCSKYLALNLNAW